MCSCMWDSPYSPILRTGTCCTIHNALRVCANLVHILVVLRPILVNLGRGPGDSPLQYAFQALAIFLRPQFVLYLHTM